MSIRFSEMEYEDYLKRQGKTLAGPINEITGVAKGKSKYRNQKVTIDGMTFDSKKESTRWQQLRMMESAGAISDLERQVSFELVRAVRLGNRGRPPIRYIADFTYLEDGELRVEDAKGFKTDVYKLKRHLMMAVHGIEVREV